MPLAYWPVLFLQTSFGYLSFYICSLVLSTNTSAEREIYTIILRLAMRKDLSLIDKRDLGVCQLYGNVNEEKKRKFSVKDRGKGH